MFKPLMVNKKHKGSQMDGLPATILISIYVSKTAMLSHFHVQIATKTLLENSM